MSQCICISLWISLIFFMDILKRAILPLLVTRKSSFLVCLWKRGTSKSCFWVSLQQVERSLWSYLLSFCCWFEDALLFSPFLPLQLWAFRKQRAHQGADGRNLICKSTGFIPLSQQKQNIVPWNTEFPCGCWKPAILQMIASSFPKGREASACVHKCHKNKPQDVFLFSPVILVFTYSFKALKNPGTSFVSWRDFLQFLHVHRWLQGLALNFGSQN